MKKYKHRALPALLAVTLMLGTGAALASGGTKSDPLITLSYLQETVIPEILSEVSAETKTLNKLCSVLNCRLEDIAEYVADE